MSDPDKNPSRMQATREAREELKEIYGKAFSTKEAAEYMKLKPEQKEEMDGMTAKEAARHLKESAKNREDLVKATREAEPSKPPEAVQTKPRNVVGPNVIDTGSGDILVGGGPNDAPVPRVIPEDDEDGGTTGGVPIEFYCYVNGVPGKITLLAQGPPGPL
jgi:hypothetical protein